MNTELEINCKGLQGFSQMPQVFNGYKMRNMRQIILRRENGNTKRGGRS
jgi:hypothetical protein